MSVAPKAPMPAISSVAAASAAHKTAQQAVGPLKGTVALRRLVDMLLFVGPSGSGKSTVIRRLQRDWPTLFEFSVSHTTRCPRRGEVHGQHYYFVTMEEFQQLVDAGHMIEYSRLCMPETSSSTPPLSKPVGNLYGTSKKALHTVLARNRVVLMDTDLLGAINIRRYCSREVVSTRPVTVSQAQRSIAQRDDDAAPAAQTLLTLSTPRHASVSLENEHAADPTTANPSKDSMLPSSPFYAAPVVTRTLRCMIIFIAPPSMQVLEQRLRERKTETEASIQLRMKVNRQWMQWAKENQSFFDHYIVNDNLDLCYAKVREIVRAEVLMVDSTL
ncbi:guanylate kinase-like protein [Leishmania infantum JPCM5]|uniref:Guanylate_kinase-like_protein n=2 Tax=Leishmania infantum TaxID=5671 RepID=A0A6L0XRR6_LEIIN|nr:guanylate kinase-like protein [Leishmania infantum JPCM5]CAC9550255.1 guanylate_kinase-like_protein [Leishmania infantum]CAM72931.1 guanylate kinase-like protein [Leishmania infantum JPCM5]SUZ46612.1 guanylate_kinase-like_protein [Leishmania infantum]|eukprot:XP_001469819.1 guanylate kinase-like protein [Leishmania infantum JPCM5]